MPHCSPLTKGVVSISRIFNADRHVGIAISGLYTDASALVEFATNEANDFRIDNG
jgi:20S proteasome alpha/beta subunit